MEIFIFFIFWIIGVKSSTIEELHYGEGPEGPNHWPGVCTTGTRQSPVDISPGNVIPAVFSHLKFTNYDKEEEIEVLNLGETMQVKGFDKWDSDQPMISGGGLRNKYKLLQLHVHWSDSDDKGSEHTIHGAHFPLKIHFVHIKEDKTLEEAILEPDGFMVLAVFGTINNNPDQLESLTYWVRPMEGTEVGTEIKFKLKPERLLPSDTASFYRYEGSLTTPNCDESVIWTVLSTPINMGKNHLTTLREIRKSQHLDYSSNVRPVQNLNGRKIQMQLRITDFSTVLTKNRIMDSTMQQPAPDDPDENKSTINQVLSCVQALPVCEQRYKCDWENCNEVFNTLLELDNHASAAHATKDPPYICHWKTCRRRGNPFEHFFSFVNHMRTHISKATHPCPVPCCTRRYRTLESLRNHMVIHTAPKPYTCFIGGCFHTFATAGERTKHIFRTHSNLKRFLCPMLDCTRRYSDPSSLRKHLKTLHGESAYMVFRELKSSVRVWEKNFRIRNDVSGVAHIVGVNGEIIDFDEIVKNVVEMTNVEFQDRQSFKTLEEDGEFSDNSVEVSSPSPNAQRYSISAFHPYIFYPPVPSFWTYPKSSIGTDTKVMILSSPPAMKPMVSLESVCVEPSQKKQATDNVNSPGASSQSNASKQACLVKSPVFGSFSQFYPAENTRQGTSQSTPSTSQGLHPSTPKKSHQGVIPPTPPSVNRAINQLSLESPHNEVKQCMSITPQRINRPGSQNVGQNTSTNDHQEKNSSK